MKFHKAQITCQKFVVEFALRTGCARVIALLNNQGMVQQIGSIEKYINDTAWDKGWVKPIKVNKELKQSIGIIGAGPAGMACGEELRKLVIK